MGLYSPPAGKPVSVYVTKEMENQLKQLVSLYGGSHSKVIREAVRLLHEAQIKPMPVAF